MKPHSQIMGTLPNSFIIFACWGMAQGFVAYLFLGINSQGAWWGNPIAVIASVLVGGIISAL
jgi:hypothetical protein